MVLLRHYVLMQGYYIKLKHYCFFHILSGSLLMNSISCAA